MSTGFDNIEVGLFRKDKQESAIFFNKPLPMILIFQIKVRATSIV